MTLPEMSLMLCLLLSCFVLGEEAVKEENSDKSVFNSTGTALHKG